MFVPAGVSARATPGTVRAAARTRATTQRTVGLLPVIIPISRFSFLLLVLVCMVCVPPSSFLFPVRTISIPPLFVIGLLNQDLETYAARASRRHRLDQFPLDVGVHVGGGDVLDLGAIGLPDPVREPGGRLEGLPIEAERDCGAVPSCAAPN